MNTKFKIFEIEEHQYVLLGLAKGIGHQINGKIAIIRETKTSDLRVIPIVELMSDSANNTSRAKKMAERLDLYKKRFVSHEDVYAHRYFNKRMKKYAYSPVVPFNNGRPLLNQWISLTDEEIKKHLMGDTFLGFYPMFPDNTTKFLVLDIDGHHQGDNWRQITSSIQVICKKYEIPFLTELSQSGSGCHLWIFFDVPTPADVVRHFGDAILKATMSINPDLSFDAFDRMFPSQDFISKDHIGNLIAGPLQGKRRKEGKSVFVDTSFTPWKTSGKVSPTLSLYQRPHCKIKSTKLASKVILNSSMTNQNNLHYLIIHWQLATHSH